MDSGGLTWTQVDSGGLRWTQVGPPQPMAVTWDVVPQERCTADLLHSHFEGWWNSFLKCGNSFSWCESGLATRPSQTSCEITGILLEICSFWPLWQLMCNIFIKLHLNCDRDQFIWSVQESLQRCVWLLCLGWSFSYHISLYHLTNSLFPPHTCDKSTVGPDTNQLSISWCLCHCSDEQHQIVKQIYLKSTFNTKTRTWRTCSLFVSIYPLY